MNARLLAHFRELLLEERLKAVAVRARIAARWSQQDHADSPRQAYDEPDASASGANATDDDAIASRESAGLQEIDEALGVLSDNPDQYGICVTCGEPIDQARLEFVPATRLCARDAARRPALRTEVTE